jgi:hypothetical protein
MVVIRTQSFGGFHLRMGARLSLFLVFPAGKEGLLPMQLYVFLWERHLAAMIVAGSHSHKGDTSLPIERRSAP